MKARRIQFTSELLIGRWLKGANVTGASVLADGTVELRVEHESFSDVPLAEGEAPPLSFLLEPKPMRPSWPDVVRATMEMLRAVYDGTRPLLTREEIGHVANVLQDATEEEVRC